MVETFLREGIVDAKEISCTFRILINKVPKGTARVKNITLQRNWNELGLYVVEKYKIDVSKP